MKYLLILFLSFPVFASRMSDHIRSYGQQGNEVAVTFGTHKKVHRMPASSKAVPCLENAWKAKKPVNLVLDDKDGKILHCEMASQVHPGRQTL